MSCDDNDNDGDGGGGGGGGKDRSVKEKSTYYDHLLNYLNDEILQNWSYDSLKSSMSEQTLQDVIDQIIRGVRNGSEKARMRSMLAGYLETKMESPSISADMFRLSLLQRALPFLEDSQQITHAIAQVEILRKKIHTDSSDTHQSSSLQHIPLPSSLPRPRPPPPPLLPSPPPQLLPTKEDEEVAVVDPPARKKKRYFTPISIATTTVTLPVQELVQIHSTLGKLQEMIQAMKPQCVICLDAMRETRFACGHVVCCRRCSDKLLSKSIASSSSSSASTAVTTVTKTMKSTTSPVCPICNKPSHPYLPVFL